MTRLKSMSSEILRPWASTAWFGAPTGQVARLCRIRLWYESAMRRTTLANAAAVFVLLGSGAVFGAPRADSVGPPPEGSLPESSPPDVPASDQPQPDGAEATPTPPPDGASPTPPAAPAAPPSAPRAKEPTEPDTDALSPVIPLAKDTVGGHFQVGVTAGLVVPF